MQSFQTAREYNLFIYMRNNKTVCDVDGNTQWCCCNSSLSINKLKWQREFKMLKETWAKAAFDIETVKLNNQQGMNYEELLKWHDLLLTLFTAITTINEDGSSAK